jgi:hypothetical protein
MINNAEEGHADDIVEATAYEAILPEAKEFLPWHLPRKQLVRQHQWCEQIGRMLDDAPLADGTLKYLGLPGVDLLDIRHFHAEFCESRDINLRFLGFNSSAKPASSAHTELNISIDEVSRLPRIDPMSLVIGDNFALVAKENSIASRKARELGPYDVINLDLCDGFGAQAPTELDGNYYNAVNSLFALQARSKSPWLLLLTTRADKQNIDPEVLQALIKKYIANLAQCQTFLEASRDKFAIETEEALRAAADTPDGLLAVFLTGLCKWFLGLALAGQPPSSVELKSVIGYRVVRDAEHEDLISLALRFTPTFIPANDPLGMAVNNVPPPNECTLATRALKGIAKRVDADKKLADDLSLNERMIDATARLLDLARYDVQAYRAWLEDA